MQASINVPRRAGTTAVHSLHRFVFSVPDLDKAVTKGSFTLNFKPKARVGARVAFKIKEPGFYLLRVHTTNTNSDHEHFSAIDLQIE